jgi:putative copper export protein/methionine-rich copper-binding protein CopC/ABC-type branched-subunit amino acid transport system substrate-binding protein
MVLGLPAGAAAHPALLQTSPSPGLIAPKPPTSIQLSFSEAAVPSGSRITLKRIHGGPVAVAPLQAPNGGQTLQVKPQRPLGEGVYQVTWSALGDDGHLVGGQFAFGVAGPHGEAPHDAQALVGAGARGSGGQGGGAFEGIVPVAARWLALFAAVVLLGGFAVLIRLRRTLGADVAEDAGARWRAAARIAWPTMVLGSAVGVVHAATAGADGFDLRTLWTSPTGQGEAIELAVLLACSAALLVAPVRRRWADVVLAGGALAVLLAQAVTGHVQALTNGLLLAATLQSVHLVSAAVWLGGLVTILLASRTTRRHAGIPLGNALRAYAPIAIAALVTSVVTGVIAAFREVDHLYFLRWSSYGNVLLIKVALVLVAIAIGVAAAIRGRRGASSPALLRAETVTVVGVLALAALLSGLAPGRGQALPAERGTLLPGPAFATAVSNGGPLRVTLTPATSGSNVLSVVQDSPPEADTAPSAPHAVHARLYCTCARGSIETRLERGRGGAWHSAVDLPADGSWYARLTVDARSASPVALPVGVPTAPGPGPMRVLSIADLSGDDAARCRSHLLGLELAIGRMNALGGLDGGRKVTLEALDDGGSAARARELAQQQLTSDPPLALAGPCGPAAAAAVREAGRLGVPSIVADPAVPPVNAPMTFRLAGDPYAEGYADAQFIRTSVEPSAVSKVVKVVRFHDLEANRRLAGLRVGLRHSGLTVKTIAPSALAAGPGTLRSTIDQRSAAAILIDGTDPEKVAGELAGLGTTNLGFAPAAVLASDRLMSERLVTDSGAIGMIGALQGPSVASPDSATSLAYSRAVPALYPGEQASLDGLRGYLAGLALEEGVSGGTDPAQIAAALREPAPFTDALLAPWRSDAPAEGSPRFTVLAGNFLPSTLIPVSKGGESYSGSYFEDGSWRVASSQPLGPPLNGSEGTTRLASTGG